MSARMRSTIHWDYSLYEGLARPLGLVAVLSHLLFYFGLHFHLPDPEGLTARMIVIALFIPLFFYPTESWRPRHKVYFELMMALTMSGYFTYQLLLHSTSLYWSVSLLFIIIFYGVFSKWQVALWLHPLVVAAAFGLVHFFSPHLVVDTGLVLRLEVIGALALIFVQLLKVFVERSHSTMVALKEKADQQNEIFSALLDISVEVSWFDDPDEIFHLLLKRLESIFPGRGYGLLVEGPRPTIIPHMAFRGISQKDTTFLLEVHSFVLGFASVGKRTDEQRLSSIKGDEWQVFGGGIRSTSLQGHTAYCFKLFIKGRSLEGEERRLLEIFLETIRGMIRSRIQALELERFSNTDHLTGLFNRSYFDLVMAQWCDKARPEKPFSVIFGDINGLKRINDTYGHQSGDLLIRSCADLLIRVVRNSDLVFRLGGDEIVILCPSTAIGEAEELLKRINRQAEKLVVDCVDEVSGEVTRERVHISFGIACSTEQGPGEVVSLADKRMFAEKERWYESGAASRYR